MTLREVMKQVRCGVPCPTSIGHLEVENADFLCLKFPLTLVKYFESHYFEWDSHTCENEIHLHENPILSFDIKESLNVKGMKISG